MIYCFYQKQEEGDLINMQELIKLAENIKNEELKKQVIDLISDFEIRLDYQKADINKAPAGIRGFHHCQKGGLIQHIKAVTEMCLQIGNTVEKTYDLPINKDYLIAGALVHDLGKLYEYENSDMGWRRSKIKLDHVFLMSAELYCRKFPEDLIHIVVSHLGEKSSTPPMTIEALILHYVDTLDSILGTTEDCLLI